MSTRTKDLVIYESPNKFRAFASMFKNFNVTFCYTKGRLFDLDPEKIGFDSNNKMTLVPVSDSYAFVKKMISQHKKVYCLTDNDAEGEWIASHISELCTEHNSEFLRLRLKELTERELQRGLKDATSELNEHLISMAISRRIMDRAIGYHDNDKSLVRGRILTPLLNHIQANTPESQSSLMVIDNDGSELVLEGSSEDIIAASLAIKNTNEELGTDHASEPCKTELFNTMDYLREQTLFNNSTAQEAFDELQDMYIRGEVSYTRTENRKYYVMEGQHTGIHAIEDLEAEDDSDSDSPIWKVQLTSALAKGSDKINRIVKRPSKRLREIISEHNLALVSYTKTSVDLNCRFRPPKSISLHRGFAKTGSRSIEVLKHNLDHTLLRVLEQLHLGTPATFHLHTEKAKRFTQLKDGLLTPNTKGVRVLNQTDHLSLLLADINISRDLTSISSNNSLCIEDKVKKCLNVLRLTHGENDQLGLDN